MSVIALPPGAAPPPPEVSDAVPGVFCPIVSASFSMFINGPKAGGGTLYAPCRTSCGFYDAGSKACALLVIARSNHMLVRSAPRGQ